VEACVWYEALFVTYRNLIEETLDAIAEIYNKKGNNRKRKNENKNDNDSNGVFKDIFEDQQLEHLVE